MIQFDKHIFAHGLKSPTGNARGVCEVPPVVPDMYGGYMPMPGGLFWAFLENGIDNEKENTKMNGC